MEGGHISSHFTHMGSGGVQISSHVSQDASAPANLAEIVSADNCYHFRYQPSQIPS